MSLHRTLDTYRWFEQCLFAKGLEEWGTQPESVDKTPYELNRWAEEWVIPYILYKHQHRHFDGWSNYIKRRSRYQEPGGPMGHRELVNLIRTETWPGSACRTLNVYAWNPLSTRVLRGSVVAPRVPWGLLNSVYLAARAQCYTVAHGTWEVEDLAERAAKNAWEGSEEALDEFQSCNWHKAGVSLRSTLEAWARVNDTCESAPLWALVPDGPCLKIGWRLPRAPKLEAEPGPWALRGYGARFVRCYARAIETLAHEAWGSRSEPYGDREGLAKLLDGLD